MPLPPVAATPANIDRAAAFLRAGQLVAFPTETVYGLGADATNSQAVAEIFRSKGRPTFNPLMVTIADPALAADFAELTPLATRLAEAFWPGGLTLVLNKRPDPALGFELSDLVSAGLQSVAVRVPSHSVARALLKATGRPIAAPSANRSGHVSATTAQHVATDFNAANAPALAIILDDGPCLFGLESTIIDARTEAPLLLRPGAVTVEAIEECAGCQIAVPAPAAASEQTTSRTSPGQLESHYAPAKPVRLNVTKPTSTQAFLAFGKTPPSQPEASAATVINLSEKGDLLEAACNLFASLRALDQAAGSSIAVAPIPEVGLGRAINDRLRRAAAPRP